MGRTRHSQQRSHGLMGSEGEVNLADRWDWACGPALAFARTSTELGAPLFALFAKGGHVAGCSAGIRLRRNLGNPGTDGTFTSHRKQPVVS